MVFYITFEFVKYTVSPDTFSDKEKGAGKLIYKIIIVIMLIAFMPTIFSTAYDFQHRIIKSQVFSKIILGHENWDYASYGSSFAADTFSVFYRVDYEECGNHCAEDQEKVDQAIETIRQEGGTLLPILQANIGSIRKGIVFDGFLALVFGCVVCYILVMYSIDLGVRYAQLLFLQIIAPVATISYLSPKKDSVFSKWVKQCVTTYLDLFIRIALMYFILLIIEVIGDSLNIFEMTRNGDRVGLLTYIFLIFGLLLFVQRAPKLFNELFPITGAASISMSLSPKERWKAITAPYRVAKSGYGIATKTAATLAGGWEGFRQARKNRAKIGQNTDKKKRNALWSTGKAMMAGAKHGYKGGNVNKAKAAASAEIDKQIKITESGGNVLEKDWYSYSYTRAAIRQDAEIEEIKAAKKSKDTVFGIVDELKEVKTLKKAMKAAEASGDAALARKLEAQYKAASQAARTAIVENNGNIPTSPITYKYSEVDERGQKIPGTEQTIQYTFDSGDALFAEQINHTNSREKAKVGTYVNDVEVEITWDDGHKEKKAIKDMSETEYIRNLHTIADELGKLETKAYNEAYDVAHANAQDKEK